MALSISCPISAIYEWRKHTVTPAPHTQELLVKYFLFDRKLSQSTIRQRAVRERTTISNALRRYVVEAYPSMDAAWPEHLLTERQIEGIARRTKDPDNVVDDLTAALRLMLKLLQDPDSANVRRRVREMILKFDHLM